MKMHRCLTFIAALLAAAGAVPMAAAQGLSLEEFEWPRDKVVCGLARAETVSDKKPAGRYIFVTALLDDPQVAIERGYANLGAGAEELDFVDRAASADQEKRRYRTRTTPRTEIGIDVKAEKAGKEIVFTGTVIARRAGEEFSIAVKGGCR